MADTFVQFPPDSTGKKQRGYRRGTLTTDVLDIYAIPASDRIVAGVYLAQTGAHLVLAAADAATAAGRWWLFNPVGSAVLVALRAVEFSNQHGSALATPTSPRIQIERFTATGTSSGAAITAAKRKTADATQVAKLVSASTGLTVTAGAAVYAFLPTAALTAVGGVAQGTTIYRPPFDEQVVLAGGEGIVCRQADAGTTSDTRRFVTNLMWEEFSQP